MVTSVMDKPSRLTAGTSLERLREDVLESDEAIAAGRQEAADRRVGKRAELDLQPGASGRVRAFDSLQLV